MQGNPYSKLVQALRNDRRMSLPPAFREGKVIGTNPLRMEVAGNIQEEEDLIESRDQPPLEVGNHCLLVPVNNEQQYWIICVRR